jgi:hypothetical protein
VISKLTDTYEQFIKEYSNVFPTAEALQEVGSTIKKGKFNIASLDCKSKALGHGLQG